MPDETRAMDKRALKILFDTYWSRNGWKDRPQVSPEDFSYAKAAGVMFDPVTVDHVEVLARLHNAHKATTAQRVANAFLASLSTRHLDLRSALGSYAVFRHMPDHAPVKMGAQCGICGHYLQTRKAEDINVLNFERFKWGGVRHDDPLYAMVDLELFLSKAPSQPTREDILIFHHLITSIETAPLNTTAAELQVYWTGVLKSNKQGRDAVIQILGFCGLLETSAHEGYRNRLIPEGQRDLPNRRFVDMAYPACWWTGADGVNQQALSYWFGHVL